MYKYIYPYMHMQHRMDVAHMFCALIHIHTLGMQFEAIYACANIYTHAYACMHTQD